MSNAGYGAPEIKSVDGYNRCNSNKDEILASYTPTQQKFYQELNDAVREHYQHLQEIAEMPNIELPTWYRAAKRSMDIFVGISGLILLLPVFLVVAILIKIDSRGTVFFNQERVGKDGKLITVYKFRTMVADAEKKTGPVWATKEDPRLTFIGKFMRKTKMDEFPQLINLVKGNMTMVGPRPERPFFVNHFVERIPGYSRRLDVTAGITGLAQLRNGYDDSALHVIHKLKYDVDYIKNMKLSTDLKLLAETFLLVLIGRA